MTELLIIKTAEAEKIKSLLTEKKLDYQVIYNEIIQEKELSKEELEKQ
ncbi:15955_t:CDS:1, partial [Funneliformis geosporum]